MPTVPYLDEPTVQQEPVPGRANPRVDTDVSAASFGGGIAQGAEAVGTAGAELGAQLKRQNDQVRITEANTQLEAAKTAMLFGPGGTGGGAYSLHGYDAMDMPNKILPQYDKVAQGIAAGLTPDQQRQFSEHTANNRSKLNFELNRYEFDESNRLAHAVYANGANQSILGAQLSWRDPEEIGKARQDLQSIVTMQADREGWTPEEKAQNLTALQAQLHQNVIGQMIVDKAPQAAASYLASIPRGEVPPALMEHLQAQVKVGQAAGVSDSILDTYRSQGPVNGVKAFAAIDARTDLPDDVKDQVRSDVQKGLGLWHDEQRQKYGDDVEKIEERIASGKADLSDRAAIWKAYREGVFTPSETGNAIGRLEKAQEKQVTADAWQRYVDGAYQKGTPLDPKDTDIKAGVSDLFLTYTKNAPPGSTEWSNRAADIAAKTGVTPQPVIDWARTQLASGEPAAAAQAAQALQRQHDVNPLGLSYATDEKTNALTKLINDAHLAGTDDEAAVKNARAIISMPDADRERVEEVYKAKQIAGTVVGSLTSQLPGIRGYDPGWFSSNATVPPQMVGQYRELQHDYYKLTNGNAAQANQLAFNDLKNTWGVTQVNGPRELMQFAPEAMHPGLTTQAIQADMQAAAVGHTADPTKVRLLVTPETYDSNGQRFALGIPDKFGAYSAITDDKGRIIPYQVPDGTAALKAGQAKAAQAGMDRLKAAQGQARDREQAEMESIQSAQKIGGLM